MDSLFTMRYLFTLSYMWSGYPHHCALDYEPMDYDYDSLISHIEADKENISPKAFLAFNFILLPDFNFIILGYCIEQVSMDLNSI